MRLTAETDAKTGRTESSVFYAGIFMVRQSKARRPVVEARIVGGTFRGCSTSTKRKPTTKKRSATFSATGAIPFEFAATKKKAKKKSKRRVRRLWGRGEGRFRTGGRRSSATVRGTWWLVEDRCDGTLTRVRRGRVSVRDFRRKTTIKLRAGKRYIYLAKAP